MAQITLYLDDEVAEEMRNAASAEGVSRSRWVADLIRQRITDEWPRAVIELAGAWSDFPAIEDLRSMDGADVERESL